MSTAKRFTEVSRSTALPSLKSQTQKPSNGSTEQIENSIDDAASAVAKLEALCREHQKFQSFQSSLASSSDAASSCSSLLDVKNVLMLSYLQNILLVMLRKLEGKSLTSTQAVWRTIECRTLLEAIRPLEVKLGYQIGVRLRGNVKLATSAVNLDEEILSDIDDDNKNEASLSTVKNRKKEFLEKHRADQRTKRQLEDQKDAEEEDAAATAHMHDKVDAKRTLQEKRTEKKRHRALQSALMNEFKSQLLDTPEEMRQSVDPERAVAQQRGRERQTYEETNFLRVNVSKKQRNAERSVPTVAGLASLADFGELRPLLGGRKRKNEREFGAGGKRLHPAVKRSISALPSLLSDKQQALRHKAKSAKQRGGGRAGKTGGLARRR